MKYIMLASNVSLVERMLELHKQFAVVRSPLDKERVGREIESTDKSIDRLVYELSPKADNIWVNGRRDQDCGR